MLKTLLIVAILISLMLNFSCSNDDDESPTTTTKTGYKISVNATYPDGSIVAGFRPSIVVYSKDAYSDYSARPKAMPMAALLGADNTLTLTGTILNLGQSEDYNFPAGSYSVVFYVSVTAGGTGHAPNTIWIAKLVTITDADQSVTVAKDDTEWKTTE